MRHDLKIWPQFFQAKISGIKPWEHRSTFYRIFSIGDEVHFHEWDPIAESFTGREFGPVVITYIMHIDAEYDIWTHTMPSQRPGHLDAGENHMKTDEAQSADPVQRLVGRISDKYVGVITNQQSNDYISVAHMIQAIATVCCANDEIIIDKLTGYLWDPDEAELLKSLFYPPNAEISGRPEKSDDSATS